MQRTPARLVSGYRIAILHQGGPVPAVNGVIKPFKPGGYQDSSADLAYNLRAAGEHVITPVHQPNPSQDADWSFPDTVAQIRRAVYDLGANVLWANTTLHAQHSLVQLRAELAEKEVRMVGQDPRDTERYEDKEWINGWLAEQDGLKGMFPRSILMHAAEDVAGRLEYPVVVKPVRGRGSHGVTLVKNDEEFQEAVRTLLQESDTVLCEEYLAGEEITITVMPPGDYSRVGQQNDHWSLPVVTRFGHINGIAPYNGIVAVTANSRALNPAEHAASPFYRQAQDACATVARLCNATAPIRIDCRRRSAEGGVFFLFDVNMKPNATGPGRPGREDQASLTTMAAEAIGWDYQELIQNIARQARLVEDVIKA